MCSPRQEITGSAENTMIAMNRRVSSVADSMGSLATERKTTSKKVMTIRANNTVAASKDGRRASQRPALCSCVSPEVSVMTDESRWSYLP